MAVGSGGTDEAFVFLRPIPDGSPGANGPTTEITEEEEGAVCGSSVTATAFTGVDPTDPR